MVRFGQKGGVPGEIPFGKLRAGSRPAGENAALGMTPGKMESLIFQNCTSAVPHLLLNREQENEKIDLVWQTVGNDQSPGQVCRGSAVLA